MGPSLNSQYSHLVLPWTANHSTTWNARDAVYSIPVECCRFGALRTTLHERFSYASGLYFSKEAPTTSEALVLLLASVTVFILTRRLKIRKPSSWLTVTKRSFQDVSTKKEPAEVQPYQFPPLRPKTISCTSMGLRRLEQANWLTFDQHYLDEHTIRSSLLESSLSQVVQCLPISASACHETLSLVTSFLTSRYPSEYTIFDTSPPTIKVHITGEVFAIGPTCPNPLEIAARLAMEDFNILMKDPVSGEYSLEASATLFPAGWKLQERIGYSMEKLHGPVPDWQKNLGKSINRYAAHFPPFQSLQADECSTDTSITSARRRVWNAAMCLFKHHQFCFRTLQSLYQHNL